MLSVFAMTGKAVEKNGGNDLPFNEAKMEKAMTALAGEASSLKDEDPRHAARLMKKFTDMTGVGLGGSMKEAMSRLEAGESPEKIEAEMGDLMNSEEDPFVLPDKHGKCSRRQVPERDNKLYEM